MSDENGTAAGGGYEASRIDIDLGRLEEEAANHSILFREASRRATNARAAHAEAKASLDVVKSETADALEVTEAKVYLEVLANPLSFGIDGKATVDGIKAAITLDERVQKVKKRNRRLLQEAVERLNKAHHLMDLLEVDVKALDHRKAMIVKEAELWIAGYFSTPKPKGEAGEKVREARKDAAFGRKRK